MKNIDKMNELVGSRASVHQIMDWAYMNRVIVADLPDVEEFKEMKASVESFINNKEILRDEVEMWQDFLVSEFVADELNGGVE